MTSASLSHPGLVRQNNEDFIQTDDHLGIYILADGMGGHNAGELASELAVRTVSEYLAEILSETPDGDVEKVLKGAMTRAHLAVAAKAMTNPECAGMGTTLVVAVVRGSSVHICHVGDSRGYLRDAIGSLHRLTDDQTRGDELVRKGILRREQVPEQFWHSLTQCVGFGPSPKPDYSRHELKPGALLLLCSDGLTDMVTDEKITTILNMATSLDSCAEQLRDAALGNGGKDNISVVLVQETTP